MRSGRCYSLGRDRGRVEQEGGEISTATLGWGRFYEGGSEEGGMEDAGPSTASPVASIIPTLPPGSGWGLGAGKVAHKK